MNHPDTPLSETHIVELVRCFYELAMADDELRKLFEATIQDWDGHHRLVENFWSRQLLGTDRYTNGSPYPVHARLPLKPEHFDTWMLAFRQAAAESLPADAATKAVARAEHMAESFKAGMFHGNTTRAGASLGKSIM